MKLPIPVDDYDGGDGVSASDDADDDYIYIYTFSLRNRLFFGSAKKTRFLGAKPVFPICGNNHPFNNLMIDQP